ncbi:hypothetical protein [Krasilnikovia sp. MM14-A1259]|uniref:hypothetical protein n=1 Tax=Krasilnikovia sp. MM14-A1259 TaxID=3373539 RepID=UPI00399D2907
MLEIRLQGDLDEARALLAFLTAAGAEVQAGGVRVRAEGFSHQYAVVRLPDGCWPGAPAAGPVWADSSIGVPARELPAGGRRDVRRRGR